MKVIKAIPVTDVFAVHADENGNIFKTPVAFAVVTEDGDINPYITTDIGWERVDTDDNFVTLVTKDNSLPIEMCNIEDFSIPVREEIQRMIIRQRAKYHKEEIK